MRGTSDQQVLAEGTGIGGISGKGGRVRASAGLPQRAGSQPGLELWYLADTIVTSRAPPGMILAS